MKKARIIAIILALVMVFSLVSCTGFDFTINISGSDNEEDVIQPDDGKEDFDPVNPDDADESESFFIGLDYFTSSMEEKTDSGDVIASAFITLPKLVALPVTEENTGIGAGWEVEDVNKIVEAFNVQLAEDLESMEQPFGEVAEQAHNIYDTEGGAEFLAADPLFYNVRIESVFVTEGGFLSVLSVAEKNMGGAAPVEESYVWNFDMNNGYFVTDLADGIADDAEQMKNVISGHIFVEVNESEDDGNKTEDRMEYVSELSSSKFYFTEEGINIVFDPFTVSADNTLKTFTVPYYNVSNCFGERAVMLIKPFLDDEQQVLMAFSKSQQLWNFFYFCSMPTTSETSEKVGIYTYNKVDYGYFTTMDYLKEQLESVFSDEITDSLLNPAEGPALYIEIDGALFAIDAARGSNIFRGNATYEVNFDDDGNGTLVVTVEELEMPEGSDVSTDWEVSGYTDIEFPFEKTETGYRFTKYESIW